jgi:hypothetical protein
MTAVIARIVLRYAAGALIAAGYLDPHLGREIGADPDLIMLVGLGIGLAVEGVYAVAKKLGWAT